VHQEVEGHERDLEKTRKTVSNKVKFLPCCRKAEFLHGIYETQAQLAHPFFTGYKVPG